MTTRLALIGGGVIAASYTTVAPGLLNAAFVAVADPQPVRAQTAVTSLQSQQALRLNGGSYELA